MSLVYGMLYNASSSTVTESTFMTVWSGKITKVQGETFHGDKCVHYLHCGQNFTGICTYQCHQTLYWKYMQFIKY